MNNEPLLYQMAPDRYCIDFYQAIRLRTVILPTSKIVVQLIEEYLGTANRVDAKLDEVLILKVLDALKRESRDDAFPLSEIMNESATERFLSESLYREILQVRDEREEDQGKLTLGDWHACLNRVTNCMFGNFPLIH